MTNYYVLARYYPISGVWRSQRFSTSRKSLQSEMAPSQYLSAVFPLKAQYAVEAIKEWNRMAAMLIIEGLAA